MGIQFMLLAAIFVATQNLIFKRSLDQGGSSKAYLTVQLFFTFLIAILLHPVRTGNYACNLPLTLFGFGGGLLLAAFMAVMGKALESGPPGLTFAVINASSVMPILVMVTVFGASFGFTYNKMNGLGSLLVVAGLFWAAKEAMQEKKSVMWALYALLAFSLHSLFLSYLQWRVVIENATRSSPLLLQISSAQATSAWFMPMIFLAASVAQAFVFITTENRKPSPTEFFYGFLGGIANGVGTFFMIWATEVAITAEQAMLFPIFAISCIVFCNLWGQRLYKEKVHWVASAVCILGLIIGTEALNSTLQLF